MNYEQLLDKGMNELPDIARVKERYEIPKAKGHVEGNKTIIINFHYSPNQSSSLLFSRSQS